MTRTQAPVWQLTTIVEMPRGMTDEEARQFLTTGESSDSDITSEGATDDDDVEDDDNEIIYSEGDALALLAGVPIGGFVAAGGDHWKRQIRAPRGTPIGGQWVDELGGLIRWSWRPSGKKVKPTKIYKKGGGDGDVVAVRSDGNAVMRQSGGKFTTQERGAPGAPWTESAPSAKKIAYDRLRGQTGEEWREPEVKPLKDDDDENEGLIESQRTSDVPDDAESSTPEASPTSVSEPTSDAPRTLATLPDKVEFNEPLDIHGAPETSGLTQGEIGLVDKKPADFDNDADVQDGQNAYYSALSSLPVGQKGGVGNPEWEATRAYQSGAAEEWNRGLRDEVPLSDLDLTDEQREWVAGAQPQLDGMLNESSLPHTVRVYRGAKMLPEGVMEQLTPGYTFEDKGYVSTSTNRDTSLDFAGPGGVLFDIEVPAGSRGLTPAKWTTRYFGEREILLPRNSRFEVIDAPEVDQDGRTIVRVRAVTDADRTSDTGEAQVTNASDEETSGDVGQDEETTPKVSPTSAPDRTPITPTKAVFRKGIVDGDVIAENDAGDRARWDADRKKFVFENRDGDETNALTKNATYQRVKGGGWFEPTGDVSAPEIETSPLDTPAAPEPPPIHNRETLAELAPDAVDAVRHYVGSDNLGETGLDHNAVNYALRYVDGNVDALPPSISGIYGNRQQITDVISGVDQAMAQSSLPEDTVVYRGVADPELVWPEEWDDNGDNTGISWSDGSFVSTTTDPGVARRFAEEGQGVVMRITAPAGTRGIGIEGVEQDGKIVKPESEILLERGLSFRVTRDYEVDGVRTLDVEVTDDVAPSALPSSIDSDELARLAPVEAPTHFGPDEVWRRFEGADVGNVIAEKTFGGDFGVPVSHQRLVVGRDDNGAPVLRREQSTDDGTTWERVADHSSEASLPPWYDWQAPTVAVLSNDAIPDGTNEPPEPTAAPLEGRDVAASVPTSSTNANTGTAQALSNYTLGGQNINRQLRNGEPMTQARQGTVDALDAALAQSQLPSDVVVYRGVPNPDKVFGDAWSDDVTDLEWSDAGFSSTSFSEGVARSFGDTVMRITVPRGTGALYNVGEEDEIILGRNTTYRMTQDHGVGSDGRRRLDVLATPSTPTTPNDAISEGTDETTPTPTTPETLIPTVDAGTPALIAYQEKGSYVNDHLRDDLKTQRISKSEADEITADLDDMFDEVPPLTEPIRVFRGLREPVSIEPVVRRAIFGDDDATGKTFSDPAFMSTSTSEQAARNFGTTGPGQTLLDIEVPAGFKAVKTTETLAHENEVLLPRDTHYEIISESYDGDTRLLKARVVAEPSDTPGDVTPEVAPVAEAPAPSEPVSESASLASTQALRAAYDAGFEVEREFGGGNVAESVELLRLSNGDRAVRKTAAAGGYHPLKDTTDGRIQTRKEFLAGKVANALGIDDIVTEQLDSYQVLTTFVDGDTGGRTIVTRQNAVGDTTADAIAAMQDDAVRRPGGREIGLLDWLTTNYDRHDGNYILTADGRVRPIDHGNAGFKPDATVPDLETGEPAPLHTLFSPFVDHWIQPRVTKSGPNAQRLRGLKPRFTKSELADVRQRLESIREFFDQPGESEWYQSLLDRLALLEAKAKTKVED